MKLMKGWQDQQKEKDYKKKCTHHKQNITKKRKEARPKKQMYELQDYVALKINREDKETPLHPNVLLAQIVELEGNYAKIIAKLGFIST